MSGLHCNSTKAENKADSDGETSESFMFLHETTFRCSSSCQCRITDSRPDVVSNEHPSRYRSFTLLQIQQRVKLAKIFKLFSSYRQDTMGLLLLAAMKMAKGCNFKDHIVPRDSYCATKPECNPVNMFNIIKPQKHKRG